MNVGRRREVKKEELSSLGPPPSRNFLLSQSFSGAQRAHGCLILKWSTNEGTVKVLLRYRVSAPVQSLPCQVQQGLWILSVSVSRRKGGGNAHSCG